MEPPPASFHFFCLKRSKKRGVFCVVAKVRVLQNRPHFFSLTRFFGGGGPMFVGPGAGPNSAE